MYWTNTVAEMTGIPKNTLIAWERRYGLVQPQRTDSGYRVYSDEDVRLLMRVKELLDEGYRISEVVRVLAREVGPDADPGEVQEPDASLEPIRTALLAALMAYDLEAAERGIRRLITLPFETLLDQVYLPLLQRVGQLWEDGEATVVQEHFVSAWCRDRILAMARSIEPRSPGAPEAVCGTAEGEQHEFGALGVAFHLANRGYRVIYLGANVPTEQLLDLIASRRPRVVAISTVLVREDFDVEAYGKRLASALPVDSRVLIGGRAADGLEERSTERLLFGARAAASLEHPAR